MKENVLRKKSFAFSLRIVKLYKYLVYVKREFVLSKQLLRSGTSVGALISEAEHAESTKDFIHKLAIAQKEANETLYWLRLLKESEFISNAEFLSILPDAKEVMSILTSILKTMNTKKK